MIRSLKSPVRKAVLAAALVLGLGATGVAAIADGTHARVAAFMDPGARQTSFRARLANHLRIAWKHARPSHPASS